MSCDIHLYTERILPIRNDWVCCDRFKINHYLRKREYLLDSIYDDRDYNLFAVLANVMNNGYIIPISQPRGLPKDVTDVVREEAEIWGINSHSFSWLYAEEVFNYQKEHFSDKECDLINKARVKDRDLYGVVPDMWYVFDNSKDFIYRELGKGKTPVDVLVERIKERMATEFNIWEFYSDEEKERRYNEYARKFRIIFWFDSYDESLRH